MNGESLMKNRMKIFLRAPFITPHLQLFFQSHSFDYAEAKSPIYIQTYIWFAYIYAWIWVSFFYFYFISIKGHKRITRIFSLPPSTSVYDWWHLVVANLNTDDCQWPITPFPFLLITIFYGFFSLFYKSRSECVRGDLLNFWCLLMIAQFMLVIICSTVIAAILEGGFDIESGGRR